MLIKTIKQSLYMMKLWEIGEAKTIKNGDYGIKLKLEKKVILPALGWGAVDVVEILTDGNSGEYMRLLITDIVGCDID